MPHLLGKEIGPVGYGLMGESLSVELYTEAMQ